MTRSCGAAPQYNVIATSHGINKSPDIEEEFMSVKDEVKELVVEQLGVSEEEASDDARFIEDLGADSLDTVELVMAFEDRFNIEIPDEDAEKIRTVGDAVRYLEDKKASA